IEDLVAQEGERAKRIERVEGEHAHGVPMMRHGGHGAVERGERVVAEQEAKPRVVSGPALLVERFETVEPAAGPRAGAHTDLEREGLRGELAALVEIAEQRPEIADGIGDGLGVIRVRLSRWERFLEASARRALPLAEPLPEQAIELPDEAVANGSPLLE